MRALGVRAGIIVLTGVLSASLLFSAAPADARHAKHTVVSTPDVLTASSAHGGGRPEPGSTRAVASLTAQVVSLVNSERANASLPPLSTNPRLTRAAQRYAEILAPGPCLAHDCGPVPSLSARINAVGYTGWRAIGENIAAGQTSAQQVMTDWMNSPSHRANILYSGFQNIGISVATGSGPYHIYWVQEFGGT